MRMYSKIHKEKTYDLNSCDNDFHEKSFSVHVLLFLKYRVRVIYRGDDSTNKEECQNEQLFIKSVWP